MMMKAAKLGWAGPGAEQEQTMSRPGAGWEQARSRPGAMYEFDFLKEKNSVRSTEGYVVKCHRGLPRPSLFFRM